MNEHMILSSLNVEDYDIYLRKSRKDEEFESDVTIEEVLARHEQQLQEYAIRLFGEKIPEHNIYREVVSGDTISDRPKMQELLHKIENNNRAGVLAIEIERLARGDTVDQRNYCSNFSIYTN